MGALQAVLDLDALAGLHEPVFVVIRLDVLQAAGVHLVDGPVHMQVVGVDMHGADALMVAVADGRLT